jgi:hypothetical protein
MACQLTIQSVLGQGPPLTSVKISGTTTNCTHVNVTIVCTGHAVTHSQVPVVGGAWSTVFTETELKTAGCLQCASSSYPITVRANCADTNESCSDYKVLPEIPCQAACPTIDHIDAAIPSCASVAAANGWNVTFQAYINGSGVTTCLWDFGDGSNPVIGSLPVGGVAAAQHVYSCAGDYPVSLTIFSDCQPNYVDSQTIQLHLPTCGCPAIEDISANSSAGAPCAWHFNAKIANPFIGCIEQYLWNFGDGQQVTTTVPSVDHTYQHDGHYTVTLTLLGGIGAVGGGPCYSTTDVNVSGCAGGGNGGKPCPWWQPRCWGSLCGGLLAAAIGMVLAAGILATIAGCTQNGPIGIVAGVAAAAAIALLWAWFAICSKLSAGFCQSLSQVMLFIDVIIQIQTIIVLLTLTQVASNLPCFVGAVLAWAFYGYVLSTLDLIRHAAHCP